MNVHVWINILSLINCIVFPQKQALRAGLGRVEGRARLQTQFLVPAQRQVHSGGCWCETYRYYQGQTDAQGNLITP